MILCGHSDPNLSLEYENSQLLADFRRFLTIISSVVISQNVITESRPKCIPTTIYTTTSATGNATTSTATGAATGATTGATTSSATSDTSNIGIGTGSPAGHAYTSGKYLYIKEPIQNILTRVLT